MTNCPNCGSNQLWRDEVDIGVGTQCGPWQCADCGWYEGHEADDQPEPWSQADEAEYQQTVKEMNEEAAKPRPDIGPIDDIPF